MDRNEKVSKLHNPKSLLDSCPNDGPSKRGTNIM